MSATPPLSKGYASGNGWTHAEILEMWLELKYFTNTAKASVVSR